MAASVNECYLFCFVFKKNFKVIAKKKFISKFPQMFPEISNSFIMKTFWNSIAKIYISLSKLLMCVDIKFLKIIKRQER